MESHLTILIMKKLTFGVSILIFIFLNSCALNKRIKQVSFQESDFSSERAVCLGSFISQNIQNNLQKLRSDQQNSNTKARNYAVIGTTVGGVGAVVGGAITDDDAAKFTGVGFNIVGLVLGAIQLLKASPDDYQDFIDAAPDVLAKWNQLNLQTTITRDEYNQWFNDDVIPLGKLPGARFDTFTDSCLL